MDIGCDIEGNNSNENHEQSQYIFVTNKIFEAEEGNET